MATTVVKDLTNLAFEIVNLNQDPQYIKTQCAFVSRNILGEYNLLTIPCMCRDFLSDWLYLSQLYNKEISLPFTYIYGYDYTKVLFYNGTEIELLFHADEGDISDLLPRINTIEEILNLSPTKLVHDSVQTPSLRSDWFILSFDQAWLNNSITISSYTYLLRYFIGKTDPGYISIRDPIYSAFVRFSNLISKIDYYLGFNVNTYSKENVESFYKKVTKGHEYSTYIHDNLGLLNSPSQQDMQ